jgi:hypothetical protein
MYKYLSAAIKMAGCGPRLQKVDVRWFKGVNYFALSFEVKNVWSMTSTPCPP